MKIKVTKNQLEILRKALSELIEKYIGLSNAQENYINNIQNGMSESESIRQFHIYNLNDWNYSVHIKKNELYCLYAKLFDSPLINEKKKLGK